MREHLVTGEEFEDVKWKFSTRFQAVNFIELQPTVLDDFAESNSVKLNRPRKIF